MKKEYKQPKITKVEFRTEVGVDGSITRTSTETWEATSVPGDGTQQYSYRTEGGGFF